MNTGMELALQDLEELGMPGSRSNAVDTVRIDRDQQIAALELGLPLDASRAHIEQAIKTAMGSSPFFR